VGGEIVELRQLKADQPELASAVDMQIALAEMQRRVQSRVPLPWIQVDPEWLGAQQAAGRPLVRFRDIPLDWSDFRLTFRQTADILQRFDALDRPDHETIVAIGRQGNALEPLVAAWYEATSGVEATPDPTARQRAWRRAGEHRARPAARHSPVSRAVRRGAQSASRPLDMDARALPVLRLGARLRRGDAERRAAPRLRPLHRAVVLRAADVSVLRERRPDADHVVCDTRRTLPGVCV
jgi:hypothetical protein